MMNVHFFIFTMVIEYLFNIITMKHRCHRCFMFHYPGLSGANDAVFK